MIPTHEFSTMMAGSPINKPNITKNRHPMKFNIQPQDLRLPKTTIDDKRQTAAIQENMPGVMILLSYQNDSL